MLLTARRAPSSYRVIRLRPARGVVMNDTLRFDDEKEPHLEVRSAANRGDRSILPRTRYAKAEKDSGDAVIGFDERDGFKTGILYRSEA